MLTLREPYRSGVPCEASSPQRKLPNTFELVLTGDQT